ncbi:MAG: hypothetical protein Q9169_008620, partial [Polycauliona sp. 2 TL-2023]
MYPYPITTLLFSIFCCHTLTTSSLALNNPSSPPPSNLLLPAATSNDWESFTYPIPSSNLILKGRFFPAKPLDPAALHSALDSALAFAQQQVSDLGPAAHLFTKDNPYTWSVQGCFVTMKSKTGVGAQVGRPRMTWVMMRDVWLALRYLLEGERGGRGRR